MYVSAGLPMAVWAESACPVVWRSRPVRSAPGLLQPLGVWLCGRPSGRRKDALGVILSTQPVVASCTAVPTGRFGPPTSLTAVAVALAGGAVPDSSLCAFCARSFMGRGGPRPSSPLDDRSFSGVPEFGRALWRGAESRRLRSFAAASWCMRRARSSASCMAKCWLSCAASCSRLEVMRSLTSAWCLATCTSAISAVI